MNTIPIILPKYLGRIIKMILLFFRKIEINIFFFKNKLLKKYFNTN